MDWYRSAARSNLINEVEILTDLIESEGFTRLITTNDKVSKLLIIDKLLFKKQSNFGDKWRNLVKLLVIPLQVLLIRIHFFRNRSNSPLYYAHSMYYMWLASLANIPFIGTPQGSDLLIKPYKSKIYKYLSIFSLKRALLVTVDSINMSRHCLELSGISAEIIQNGIDVREIAKVKSLKRVKIVSLRAITSLYRIDMITSSRNYSSKTQSIEFIFPFSDSTYLKSVEFNTEDILKGRLEKSAMYSYLKETILAISIPSSDSSPRSVYEAIFCGTIVAVDKNNYIEKLPSCMKSRIIVVDLVDPSWFDKALRKSLKMIKEEYQPSMEALRVFDQFMSFEKKIKIAYDKFKNLQ